MAKSDFNNSVFVVKVYEHTTPSIVEVFPATEQGISDAHRYCEIMERTGKGRYDVVVPITQNQPLNKGIINFIPLSFLINI